MHRRKGVKKISRHNFNVPDRVIMAVIKLNAVDREQCATTERPRLLR